MIRHAIGIAALAGMVATGVAASAQDRPSRQCVREIVELCGRDRSKIAPCLREKLGELSAACRAELGERMQQRRIERAEAKTAALNFETVSYGDHERQGVDFYRASDPSSAPPLILFVHGGGWSFGNRTQTVQQKPAHFVAQGYAFASAGYRVLPDAPVEEQARDIGAAIAALRRDAARLGFDPGRIVLMGHSAGAHLAALVSTDPQYTADADFAAIRAVVLLDGAGYDVPARMAGPRDRATRLYSRVFGTDPQRQAALSPITHVGEPDAPAWLVLYVADRAISRQASQALARALSQAGASADAIAISETDHGRLNRELGTPEDAATSIVDEFLAGALD